MRAQLLVVLRMEIQQVYITVSQKAATLCSNAEDSMW